MLPSNVSDYASTNPPPRRSGGPRFSVGLLLTVILLVFLGAVIFFAVTRMPVGTPARPTPVAATRATPAAGNAAPPAGSPADAATAAAIQDVIKRLDTAQAQAIQSGNPQLMADTASPQFYAEEVATNQDLVDSGVSEVELVNIEWGDIYVQGDTANATAYETWTTTFTDGTTLQARDRNVYTLNRDSNGTWKVSADDHPDQQQ
jgi:ketosteroid isomerase-like protein